MSAYRKTLIESETPPEAFVSRRIEDGVEARIGFIGPPSQRLFAAFSLPTSPVAGAVLICSSLHVDFTKNYRNEVLLGWALAKAGLAVLRFHYRGSGHSDGENDEITFASMCEDAALALDHLRSHVRAGRLALIGCRLGAIIAATTVARLVGSPLVLWEPVIAGPDYVREALRARRLSEVAGGSAKRSSDVSVGSQRVGRSVEVHGSAISSDFIESLIGRTLAGELGDLPRPIMLLRASRQERIPSDLQRVLQGWNDDGFTVELERISSDFPWWFTGAGSGRDQTSLLAREGIAPTLAWVRRWLVGEAR
jgi:hypothetical protein